ncbi:MAG: family transcriptional regulator [Bryobacterales bacterium]|nr:family transcriptional regulator [Bryobacterales bacterium]
MKLGAAAKRILRPLEVRGANRAAVLLLLQQSDYLSRADVARQSGLSEGAISRIVMDLLDEGLVREDGAENSTGGRPGRRLALDQRRVVFGAEIQNWETRCAMCTLRGRVVRTERFRTPESAVETLEQVARSFTTLSKEFGQDRVPGIGICARGIVNSETGVLVLGNTAEWHNVPVREFLERRLKEPVEVENNVRAAALAEYTYGLPDVAGRHCFLFVKVDEGVGMGVLFDGKLYPGPHMAAGEFGQMVIEAFPGEERHDRPGCLERLISNPAICNKYADLVGNRRQNNGGDTSARVRRIAEMARAGDLSARQVIREVSRHLGLGISNMVWALDADAVVVDAPITEAWSEVESVLRRQLPDARELLGGNALLVRPSVFGGEAALIGAATLPLASIFAGLPPMTSPAGVRR